MTDLLTSVLFATIIAATPIALAGLGELVTEKSGMLNLGAEGIMAVGAIAAFVGAFRYGSEWVGVLFGMAAGVALSMVFALLTLKLLANQVATGLALAIFGTGFAAFSGKAYEAQVLTPVAPWVIPWLSDLPIVGKALFSHQSIVYLSWLIFAAVVWLLSRSRLGLVINAVGESPQNAHAVGLPVLLIRLLAIGFGGAMAGLGGAFLSVFYTPFWTEHMVAGRGWIALALVVFATWRPIRLFWGAHLFGGILVIQLFVQSSSLQIEIPSQLLTAMPYLVTIVVLVLISGNSRLIRLNSPASLGLPFRPD
ncbi:MAG: ABC transporter permease [Bordetella sp.]